MKVIINETNELMELSYIDKNSGCDCIADVASVGSNEDFEAVEGFSEDAERGAQYRVSQETYDWWTKFISSSYEADALEAEIREHFDDANGHGDHERGHDGQTNGNAYIDGIINDAGHMDMGDIPGEIIAALEPLRRIIDADKVNEYIDWIIETGSARIVENDVISFLANNQ